MNGLKGLEQQLYTVPPVSLRANAKVYAGGGKCLSFSFYILDAFSFFLFTFDKKINGYTYCPCPYGQDGIASRKIDKK